MYYVVPFKSGMYALVFESFLKDFGSTETVIFPSKSGTIYPYLSAWAR